MDNFGLSDRICEMDESELYTILDAEMENTDTFDSAKIDLDNYEMSPDWLEFFDDPVLNDKMMTDASNSPVVKSEHSYSIGKDADGTTTVQVKTEPASAALTLDDNPGPAINPKFLKLSNSELANSVARSTTQTTPRAIQTVTVTKQEPKVIFKNEPIIIEARRPYQQQSLLKPSTILLTKQHQQTSINLQRYDSTAQMVDNDMDEGIYLNVMPMTPPGSGSDSESGSSPRQSPTPSPIRQVIYKSSSKEINPATAIYSQPIPTSGILVLTEEEKRTLISEGYPIPTKLPLSKMEEKNLKKVRRKIKNKISAQESRRKRKEYMDHLEKKMEDISRENSDLRKKCDKFEHNNQSLMSQLAKLQNLLKKIAPQQVSAQTGICLMVMILCFAVFFGDWIPSSLGYGYGLSDRMPASSVLSNTHSLDTYTSLTMKPSRTLLSAFDEEKACGNEPWPLTLARKSYECIASLLAPQPIENSDYYSNISDQPLVFTSAQADGIMDS